MVWKGNSDPFDSMAVSLTPKDTEVLRFLNFHWFPACFNGAHVPSWIKTASVGNSRRELMDALQNGCVAPAYMSTFMEVLVLLGVTTRLYQDRPSEWVNEMLRLKGRSIASLRGHLHCLRKENKAVQDADADGSVFKAMQFLFKASCLAGNHAEAAMHGRSVYALLSREEKENRSTARARRHHSVQTCSALANLAWFDCHLAVSSMRRPIWDCDWVTDMV
jgi:hypothetical protein